MVMTASGSFDVTIQPAASELGGAVGRFELSKTFRGDLQGVGAGIMLSGGNPAAGAAGYVAIETVHGSLSGREGDFAFQQYGLMRDGSNTLHYAVVPGSGTGQLEGLSGTLELTIDDDGTHRYELDYEL